MTADFNQSAKPISDEIIAISVTLADKMEPWANVFTRLPDSPNVNVTAGYITDWTRPNAMEVLVEVQAKPGAGTALVRTQVIETLKSDDGNERFDQVSLHFAVDYDQARQLVEKGSNTTREDIAALMHAPASQLARVSVSDQTGKDDATGQLYGNRYDFDADELADITESTEQQVTQLIRTVLARLNKSATREAAT